MAAPLSPEDSLVQRRLLFNLHCALQTPFADDPSEMAQVFGDAWERTGRPYVNCPGFRPLPGTWAEYNGKFVCGQRALPGGACVTADGHLRASFRVLFHPRDRWQFSGVRLAEDI